MMFLKLLLLNSLLYIMAIALSTDETAQIEDWDSVSKYYFLKYILPFHYNLNLKLTSDSIRGESNISIYIDREIQSIALHTSTSINITEVKLISVKDGMIYKLYNTFYDILKELFILSLNNKEPKQNLKYGIYTLHLKFNIKSNETIDLLRTYMYTEENKEFATLIQPKRARQLFPCLDEPKLRATFKISVEHDIKYKVISNMPIQKYKSVDNYTICTVFQMTPPMSTNDVAIVIFDQIVNKTDTMVDIWCRPHLVLYMLHAQYVAGNVIKYLKSNFKTLTIVPKMNYVAIPSLENRIKHTWGLVLYNEPDIIYNEELHFAAYKTIIMRSVVRDIIHQWIGNLFSPFCQSYRLLNEGFITFFEIYVIEKAFPDPRIKDLLIVQTQHEALHLNYYFAMNSFARNTISISKIYSHFPFFRIIGAAIWRMLNGILPHNTLIMGLNAYFNIRFAYPNSPTPDDLCIWSFIQTGIDHKLTNKLYNLNIKQIMDIWTMQTHCPVVNVIRDYSNNLVKISKEIHDELDWKPYLIPVSYTTETNINFVNTSQSFNCLTQLNPEVEIYYDNKDKWFIANILQTGYYRVNYDTENWQMIARYLNSEEYGNIHVINRAQIIDDAFHLTIEKKLDFSIFWEVASYLWRERNYVAWYPMIKAFERISNVFAFSTHYEHFKKIEMIIGTLFEDINEDIYDQMEPTDGDLNKYLKQELTKWGCLINNVLCLKMTNKQFEWHLSGPKTKKLLPGWEKLISCNSLKTVSYQKWFGVWILNIYEKKFDYEMLKYLSCSNDPQIILTYLKFNLPTLEMLVINYKNMDFERVRREKKRIYALTVDIFFSTLVIHAKNPIILKDILENFEIIKNRLIISDNNSDISTIATLIVIINNVYSKNELDMINKFAKNMMQLASDVERKITTRLLEIESQIKYYQTIFPQSSLITIDSITIRRTTTRLTTTLSTTMHPTTMRSTTTHPTTTRPTTTRPTTTRPTTTRPTTKRPIKIHRFDNDILRAKHWGLENNKRYLYSTVNAS